LREKQLYDIASRALASGDVKQAIAACRELNSQFPDDFNGWFIASELHLRLKNPKAGLFAAEKAFAIRPDNTNIQLQLVACLQALHRSEEAKALLLKVADKNINNADSLDRIGLWMAGIGLHEQALEQYCKAIKLNPKNAVLYYNAASAQRFLGKVTEAGKNLDKSLSINRLDYEAQAMRSSLKKQTLKNNHIDELKEILLDKGLANHGEASICYALAKELDDLSNCAESFTYLKRGADGRRQQMSYQIESDLQMMSQIRSAYPMEMFNRGIVGDSNNEAIFILGLPRTGTTLVERILGSHSCIFAAGELDTFGREMMKQLNRKSGEPPPSREQLAQLTTELDFSDLGSAYIEGTREITRKLPHFIDKLPFNSLYSGLIHLALPNARIINLTRHPMAACYAIYKQLFRDVYPYSYNLEDLGRYYVAYHQLMTHWHQVMPGVIYSIAYEDVVADTEAEAKKLITFCGLNWEEQCLDFHKNKQASTTASAVQVRQPVYSSSLDRWRLYREELKPLEKILNEAGINTD
jgi:tetratricopeptide (TPR) repeat protein